MLKEVRGAEEHGEPRRRWFSDEYFDLIVWFSEKGTPEGFQLCYDRRSHERALTWTEDAGYGHSRIDDGEDIPTKNRSPILVSDGSFPAADILKRFEMRSTEVEPQIRQLVSQKLREYAIRAGQG